MIGNAFMASVPGHPLWKWLIPQTIKRYYADRAQKDEKDATKITGPIAVDNTIQRNPEITRSCALLKPDVTAPAYDLNQNVYSRCQDILKKGESESSFLSLLLNRLRVIAGPDCRFQLLFFLLCD